MDNIRTDLRSDRARGSDFMPRCRRSLPTLSKRALSIIADSRLLARRATASHSASREVRIDRRIFLIKREKKIVRLRSGAVRYRPRQPTLESEVEIIRSTGVLGRVAIDLNLVADQDFLRDSRSSAGCSRALDWRAKRIKPAFRQRSRRRPRTGSAAVGSLAGRQSTRCPTTLASAACAVPISSRSPIARRVRPRPRRSPTPSPRPISTTRSTPSCGRPKWRPNGSTSASPTSRSGSINRSARSRGTSPPTG